MSVNNGTGNVLSVFTKIFKSTPFAMIVAMVLAVTFVTVIGFPTSVSGNSMFPTLKDGQFAVVNRLDKKLERNDIIVLNDPSQTTDFPLIKRVIGIAGDTVQIIDGYVYVNNEKREESYEKIEDAGKLSEPITLKEGEYIVLGDNRNHSKDSSDFGIVNKSDVIGTVYTKQHTVNK